MRYDKRLLAVVLVLSAIFLGTTGLSAEGELTVLTATGGFSRSTIAAVEAFQAETGTRVRLLNYAYSDAREQQMLDLVSGRGAIDVVAIDDVIWLAEVHPYLEPLDGLIKADKENLDRFVPSMLELFRYQKQIYALPFRIGGWVVIYRQDLLAKAGVSPEKIVTWDDFLDAAIKMTTGEVYGFAPAFQQGNFLVNQWLPILLSHGGELLSKDNKRVAFNNATGRRATQYMVDLLRKHHVVPPAATTYEHEGVITALQRGTAAMALTYSPYYLEVSNAQKSRFSSDFAILDHIPGIKGKTPGQSIITGWGFGINKASRNKNAAWEFIKYVTSEKIQLDLALNHSNSPTVKAVFDNSAYKKEFPSVVNISKALNNARPRPCISSWSIIEDILASELSSAVQGKKTVKKALDDAAKAIQAKL